MNRVKSLYQELLEEKNRFLSDDDSFNLVGIYTNLLYALVVSALVVGMFLIVFDMVSTRFIPFTLNDYMSVCLGNTCFFFSFRLIKAKVIPYYASNPIMLIGLIYPAFFNASLIQMFVDINPIIKVVIMILSMLLYYFILNKYYQAKYYKNNN